MTEETKFVSMFSRLFDYEEIEYSDDVMVDYIIDIDIYKVFKYLLNAVYLFYHLGCSPDMMVSYSVISKINLMPHQKFPLPVTEPSRSG